MSLPSGPAAILLLALVTAGPEAASDGRERFDAHAGRGGNDGVEDIQITGRRTERAAPAESWNTVPVERVRRSDARSAADVLRRAPGALVQTNSRGQTLVVLRNAGERQVTVFFDGAPLEIPWDHRFDLNLLPAAAIGRTEVARGPLSNRYGPNISGGAVFLEPPESPSYVAASFGTEGGTGGLFRFEGSASAAPSETLSLLVAAERTEWAGQPLAEPLPFSQADGGLRTNTDARRTTALGRVSLASTQTELTLSVLYGSAALGVAPEGHLDPQAETVRFWRYPDTELAMVIAGLKTLEGRWAADAVVWGQAFDQTIESFDSVRYDRLGERQRDRDQSLGGRARVAAAFGAHQVSVAAYGRVSAHEETRTEVTEARSPSVEEDRFVHGLWSAGADYLLRTGDLRVRLGAGIDGLEPIETADRPSPGGIRGWNASGGGRVELTSALSFRGAVGSRARLPTPRELFGTALDRFVLNASLGPERTTSVEVGMTYDGAWAQLELVPFASWTSDTLDQENVVIDGTIFRRRVNLDGGSRVFGLEAIGTLEPTSWIRCAGQLLISDVRSLGTGARRLAERPAVQAFGELVLGADEGLELATEVVARSAAFSLAPEGLRRVSGAALVNVRGAYRFSSSTFGDIELYARIDNVFDARLEPQLGLPEPGRWLRIGLAWRL